MGFPPKISFLVKDQIRLERVQNNFSNYAAFKFIQL